MKQLFLVTAVVSAICIFAMPALPQKTPATGSDSTFLNKAIEANAAEVQVGKLAQMKSQNPRVKDFAEMMVKDHSNALDRLNDVNTASGSGGTRARGTQSADRVTLSKQHQELRDRLSKLSGTDFDREYVNAMVEEHRNTVQDFEREAGTQEPATNAPGREKPESGTGTPDRTKAVAQELLPTIKMHLQEAESLQRQMGTR